MFDEQPAQVQEKPAQQQKAGYKDPHDQQYMTLAGLDNQIFDQQQPDRLTEPPYPAKKPKGKPTQPPPRLPPPPKTSKFRTKGPS